MTGPFFQNPSGPSGLFPGISGSTRVFGILGDSLSHSLSQVFWNAAFRSISMDAVYVPFPVAPDFLEPAFIGLCRAGVAGLNVTNPFKGRMAQLVSKCLPPADSLETVNTVIIHADGTNVGVNTDADALLSILKEREMPMAVTLLGAGGAARAVLWALCQRKVPVVYWSNRTAARLVYPVSTGETRVERTNWTENDLKKAIDASSMLIQATTLGWNPEDQLSVLEHALTPHHEFIDLNYNPQSALLKMAMGKGSRVTNGLEILLRQGMAAFAFLTGTPAPEAVMRQSLMCLESSSQGVG